MLLVADENCYDLPFCSLGKDVEVVTNRIDVAGLGKEAGLRTRFSDFDLSPWRSKPPHTIIYRISKEKAIVHHVANQAHQLLSPGGRLVLFGGKQEGIKSFAKTVGKYFGTSPQVEKEGSGYRVSIAKAETGYGHKLDDKNYSQLREISSLGGRPVYSKPGIFGWDKVDLGSALLAAHLSHFLQAPTPNGPMLDLGCGYGYLSLVASLHGFKEITATDNCAAALKACQKNFFEWGIQGQVVAADCGEGIATSFSTIVCNPPFHRGFQMQRALTEKFLSSTRRLLVPGGRAFFVVNQFVPLESLASKWFRHIETPEEKGGFKLVTLG